MLVLVGLGNPEPKYQGNRHNVGFMAVSEIARRWRFGPEKKRFQSLACEGDIETPKGAVRTLILKPQTYYNGSGDAVREAVRFYKLQPADVVVFHDEIDLAPGRFRMKAGGGAAGNNGIRSISAHVGEGVRRARIGVGHPGDKAYVQNYVLSDFHKVDQPWLEPLLAALADAAPFLAAADDERYQAEVLRLAPAEKADPKKRAPEA
jgi:PTH1 family peptidyl-tRNA hydrolase